MNNNQAIRMVQKLYNGGDITNINQDEISSHSLLPTKEKMYENVKDSVNSDSLSMIALVILGMLVIRTFIK